MDKILIPLIFTTISGLSTMIGAVLIFFTKEKNTKILVGALSFSAAIMLSVSFLDLIPNGYTYLIKQYNLYIILIFIIIGLIFSYLIDQYIPSKIDNIYKLGIFSFIALIMHNIPEGIITFMTSYDNFELGLTLTIAIMLHNIPEGIAISLPIYYSTKSKAKALLLTFISGIAEPIGGLIVYLLFYQFINDTILNGILLFVAGMMIYISVIKMLPTALKYKRLKTSLLFFITGVLIILLTHYII